MLSHFSFKTRIENFIVSSFIHFLSSLFTQYDCMYTFFLRMYINICTLSSCCKQIRTLFSLCKQIRTLSSLCKQIRTLSSLCKQIITLSSLCKQYTCTLSSLCVHISTKLFSFFPLPLLQTSSLILRLPTLNLNNVWALCKRVN